MSHHLITYTFHTACSLVRVTSRSHLHVSHYVCRVVLGHVLCRNGVCVSRYVFRVVLGHVLCGIHVCVSRYVDRCVLEDILIGVGAQANNITRERLEGYDRPIKSEPKFTKEQAKQLREDLFDYLQTLKVRFTLDFGKEFNIHNLPGYCCIVPYCCKAKVLVFWAFSSTQTSAVTTKVLALSAFSNMQTPARGSALTTTPQKCASPLGIVSCQSSCKRTCWDDLQTLHERSLLCLLDCLST